MKMTNIAAYIAAKDARINAAGRIVNKKFFVSFKEKWISREEFYKQTPDPTSLLKVVGYKGENKCTRVENIK